MSAPCVLLIGNLDGVHRGHQALLRQGRILADQHAVPLIVLTFDPHPSQVLRGETPPRLATVERRVELLRRHGADEVVVEPFRPELAAMSPADFARTVLVGRFAARAVVVGQNFRFGAHRAGGLDALRELGSQLGFEVAGADVLGDQSGTFSSTRIRTAIAAGDLSEATRLLGRRHSISGVVEGGDQRGRTIGFPTANLGGVTEVLPPHGVYAVFAGERPAVMNLGVRPTVAANGGLRIEVHLLDFSGDLYGEAMRVHLVGHVREERKLAGLEALKQQIALDVAAAREMLATSGAPGDGAASPG